MADIDEIIAQIEATENNLVELAASGHTKSVIYTKGLGPCIGFIWSLNLDGTFRCILDHYSFSDDESNTSIECTMIFLLERFLSLLEDHFKVPSLFTENNICRINDMHLIATGGDHIEGAYFRQACFALGSNCISLNQLTNNEKVLYIYPRFKDRVITLQPVTKCLSTKTLQKAQERNKLPIEYPSVWAYFSCVMKTAFFRLRWKSPTGCFHMAAANLSLGSTKTTHLQWTLDTRKINAFKARAKPAETKRLDKALELIPNNGIFHTFESFSFNNDDDQQHEHSDSEDGSNDGDYSDGDYDLDYYDNHNDIDFMSETV